MFSRSVLNYEDVQYITQILLSYAAPIVVLGLPFYLLTQCHKKGSKKGEKVLGKKSTRLPAAQAQADKTAMNEAPKEVGKEMKEEEKVEKKEEPNPPEPKDEGKKTDHIDNSNDEVKVNKAEKEEEKKEEKKKIELKPKQIKRNEKEERIAQGKEVRNKGDYPTFNDVESDWDSDKDKKDKDKNKNKEGSKKSTKEEKANLASVKQTQTNSDIVPPTSVTADPAQAKVAAKGGKWTQQINNRGDKKLIFKIRCSNNNAYRVSPVFGFIDASGNTNIEVIRLSGAPKEDKLVVQYAVAPADATDAQTAFAQLQPTGNLVVNVVAA